MYIGKVFYVQNFPEVTEKRFTNPLKTGIMKTPKILISGG
jgi:hypothetical protein